MSGTTTEVERYLPDEAAMDGFAQICRGFIDRALSDRDGSESLMPQILAFAPGDNGEYLASIFVVARPFNTAVEKSAAMHQVAQALHRSRTIAMAVAIISEAWVAPLSPDGRRDFVLPEDSPRRKECAIYTVMSIDRKCRGGDIPLQRDDRAMLRAAGEWKTGDRGTSTLLATLYRAYADCCRDAIAKAKAKAKASST